MKVKYGLLLFLLLKVIFLQGRQIPLYDKDKVPYAKSTGPLPALTVYKPSGKPNGTAVIVCSGGSYGGRANGQEGIPAAKKLQEAGIVSFLLDYRVPYSSTMTNKEIAPLMDAQ